MLIVDSTCMPMTLYYTQLQKQFQHVVNTL